MSPRSSRHARAAMATPALLLLFVTCLAGAIAKLRGGGHFLAHGGGAVEGAAAAEDGGVSLEHSHHGHRGGKKQYHDSSESQGNAVDYSSYDNYVYSMSYQPEFCRENNEKFAGCRKFEEAWEGQLTIHGLWPNRDDGTWPSMCSNEKLDIALLEDLSDELSERWPNIKSPPTSPGHESFWEHEWSKHGTCSGLDQHDYFSTALNLLLPTPSIVKEKYGSTVKRTELMEGYGEEGAVFACNNGFLSEIRVCFEKAEGGAVGARVKCPESVLKEDSCGEDEIKIASFGAEVPMAVA